MIQRFSFSPPAPFEGLEDLFPRELQEGIRELIRRYTINENARNGNMRANVLCDPDALPSVQSGNSPASETLTATDLDIDDSIIFSAMLQG